MQVCWPVLSTTGPIFMKTSHDEFIKLQKTPKQKNWMKAWSLGNCGTMSSCCFVFVLTLLCALLPWLSNDYWVIQNWLETECWHNFYDKALFLSYADSTDESIESNFKHTMYTSKKSLVQNEHDGKFSTNHVQNSTSCNKNNATHAICRIQREYHTRFGLPAGPTVTRP